MAKEEYEIPVRTDYGDVLIHDTDHGNAALHPCPHAHDVNIPKGEDETYLDKARELTDIEKRAYDDHKKNPESCRYDYSSKGEK